MKNVYIIAGAPGSGKSTYVRNRKAPNDLVIDLDYICAALQQETNVHKNHDAVYQAAVCMRDSLYPFIAMRYGNWNECWIITSEPRRDKLKELAKKVRATDIIEMETSITETLNRINRDQSRGLRAEDFKQMAKRWQALHDRPPYTKK